MIYSSYKNTHNLNDTHTQIECTVGLGHAFRQVEEMIASSILGVRGRPGARWNHMNLGNTDPMIPKTVIPIIKI